MNDQKLSFNKMKMVVIPLVILVINNSDKPSTEVSHIYGSNAKLSSQNSMVYMDSKYNTL